MFDFLNRRPDFLIVGAQKAGTSALGFFLNQHPRIKCARRKEVGFFNRDKFYALGPAWYARQFPRRLWPGGLLFEATPEYLYYPFVAERIFQFNPRIKLIVLLRNPVERAFSAWNMFKQIHSDPRVKEATIQDYLEDANPEIKAPLLELLRRPEFPAFQDCVQAEIEALRAGRPQPLEPSFVRRGLYAEQVDRFYRLFPRENIFVLESAELRADQAMCLNRALRFLGAKETGWEDKDLRDQHVRPRALEMEQRTSALLREFFAPHNARLCPLLGREFNWESCAQHLGRAPGVRTKG
jgi:hypothetical protein